METEHIPHGTDMTFFRRLSGNQSLFPNTEYQRLEYIGMDTNCYITIGNQVLPSIGVMFDLLISSRVNQYGPLLVTSVQNEEQGGRLITLGARTYASGTFCNIGGTVTNGLGSIILKQRVQIYLNVRNDLMFEVPAQNLQHSVTAGSVNSGIITLCQDITSPENSYYLKGRIYGVTFYSEGHKKIELVPCYRKSDGANGLIDVYTNTFYGNNGSGTITRGPEV